MREEPLPTSSRETSPADLAPARQRRGPLRTVVYPLLVIAAIAAAIWWLEYRPGDGAESVSGERYGPIGLPSELVPQGAEVLAKEGALAPDFLLKTLDGGELRLSDFRGRPVVLNFWATWCAPCRKEIPHLVEAYDEYNDQGLVIVGVNLQEARSIVQGYATDFGMDFPIAIDSAGSVAGRYRLFGLPTTFFIDRSGTVRSVFTGPFLEGRQGTSVQGAIEQSDLEKRIAEVMG